MYNSCVIDTNKVQGKSSTQEIVIQYFLLSIIEKTVLEFFSQNTVEHILLLDISNNSCEFLFNGWTGEDHMPWKNG